MFKATEVERTIREINLLIDMQMQINLSSCRTIISCCVSNYCHGTRLELKMYHLHMRKIFRRQTNNAGRKTAIEITSGIFF